VPHFLDTNVLLYSISDDPAEKKKRRGAIALLDRHDGAISIQALQEFYVQATHPRRADRISHELAVSMIEGWSRFQIQDMTMAILGDALAIKAAHGFSYWDSAVIAAAKALGCDTLYTEDMSHGRTVEGVAIINPFR